eukprot:8324256-Alexandrium_andersonii.AAC.1
MASLPLTGASRSRYVGQPAGRAVGKLPASPASTPSLATTDAGQNLQVRSDLVRKAILRAGGSARQWRPL